MRNALISRTSIENPTQLICRDSLGISTVIGKYCWYFIAVGLILIVLSWIDTLKKRKPAVSGSMPKAEQFRLLELLKRK